MPAAGSSPDVLIDTSVAVALLLEDHEAHGATTERLQSVRLSLAGHAAFETFSVLTRLPPPSRRSPSAVRDLLKSAFIPPLFLPVAAAQAVISRLANAGIAGGAVYDALVGSTAIAHGQRLVTRDRRALTTYRAIEVDIDVLAW